jgi:hypothetical protein
MRDDEYTPFRRYVDPKRQPGERLWTVLKDTVTHHVELRDDEQLGAGTELQLFRNEEFIRGRRFKTRAQAIAEADALHAWFSAEGWIG